MKKIILALLLFTQWMNADEYDIGCADMTAGNYTTNNALMTAGYIKGALEVSYGSEDVKTIGSKGVVTLCKVFNEVFYSQGINIKTSILSSAHNQLKKQKLASVKLDVNKGLKKECQVIINASDNHDLFFLGQMSAMVSSAFYHIPKDQWNKGASDLSINDHLVFACNGVENSPEMQSEYSYESLLQMHIMVSIKKMDFN